MKFKYINRRKDNLLVLIPGWASDQRIFAPLNLRFNYLIPLDFSPFTFEKRLLEALRRDSIERVSLFGWSLGGFVATEFAAKYPDLIDEIILVGIRKRYKREEMAEVRRDLKRSKRGYLYKFYTQCFFNQEQMRWFRKNLLKDYCEQLDLNYLLESLDYLENAEIGPNLLNRLKKLKIIHGEYDSIASIQEARGIKSRLPQARFICIKETGHIPFLKKDFEKYI